jgi:NTE family protein
MTARPKSSGIEATKAPEGLKAINLALQGGGSHGAFTWGVLDRLLEDERLTFDGITATGVGSINAVVLADGLASGGRKLAKRRLEAFWTRMSEIVSKSVIAPSFFDQMNPTFGLEHSPGYLFVDFLSRFMSPYQLNPFDINPLRNLLNELVDFQRVRQQQTVKLFLSATSVRTGKIAIFRTEEITAEHVIAADCMPFRTRAPKIGTEHYWDGGFMGNPAIFPVIYECDARDVLLVHVTPAERTDLPTSARAILDRMEEIVFNAALMREMRVITMITRMIDDGQLSGNKRMFFHLIEAGDITRDLSASSKMNFDWKFLTHLFAIGRARAERWLTDNFELLGVKTTLDLHSKYL